VEANRYAAPAAVVEDAGAQAGSNLSVIRQSWQAVCALLIVGHERGLHHPVADTIVIDI
jgi:hypothetical protein